MRLIRSPPTLCSKVLQANADQRDLSVENLHQRVDIQDIHELLRSRNAWGRLQKTGAIFSGLRVLIPVPILVTKKGELQVVSDASWGLPAAQHHTPDLR